MSAIIHPSLNHYNYKVVATGSIRDYGIIVCVCTCKDNNTLKEYNCLNVYRFKNAIGNGLHN
jgi:hypothetical protein|nr:MAG TPA: hypothetical protein [Caudoviricetes sp.]DAQ64960.1 MAG TPA: hypothetical protein [Bacteriophage sp.]DAV24025.1 MAG TPA: hypothetical protein [Bacteriophage sp.]